MWIHMALQKARDTRFNEAALRIGFSVLRLHFMDTPRFASNIQKSFERSRIAGEPFLQYSEHFYRRLIE